MKKRSTIIMILMMFSLMTFAQHADHGMSKDIKSAVLNDPHTLKNEITLGYGAATMSQFVFDLMEVSADIWHEVFNKDSVKFTDERTTGAIAVGYNRFVNKVVAIGGLLTVQGIHQTTEFDKGSSFRSSAFVISLMPSVYFNYIRRPVFSVYSGFAVGASLWMYNSDFSPNNVFNTKGTAVTFATQITGIGMRVGKDLAGFVELGFGTEGLIKAGLSVKFNKTKN